MEFQKPIVIAFLLLTQVIRVFADCSCEDEEIHGNKSETLKYKLIALASILIAGGIGVSLPFAGKILPALRQEKDGFFFVKSFAAGVMLATGFIHILPDAFESLTSPCLKEQVWGDFPFTGFVAMVATIVTLMFESWSAACQPKNQTVAVEGVDDEEKNVGVVTVHMHATHHHSHANDNIQVYRYRIISQVLELGIVTHSIIIGLSLGASKSPETIKPLIVALSFHQFFEGLGLGGCIFQAKIKSLAIISMGAFFTLTTPGGIVIGILMSNSYKENSTNSLIVEGVLNAASAGMLIYMALVNLISPDFNNPRMQNKKMLLLGSNVFLLLGAGLMSLLAKWA
ncbi:zinc transporter 3 [Lactuca sativa]|uniref:zinc transporter 3 n=1 Tax=Lactuca sativa TaxID=4236 RepID=UPI000CD86E38|nr:zinc transporter 3 [Lactuca sativa]